MRELFSTKVNDVYRSIVNQDDLSIDKNVEEFGRQDTITLINIDFVHKTINMLHSSMLETGVNMFLWFSLGISLGVAVVMF